MSTIFLVRHGQGSFGGEDYDVLSSQGRAQAAALAGELARRGVRPDLIVSGSLSRQRDTVAAVAGGLPVVIDQRWNEYDSDDILQHHSASGVRQDRPPGSDAPEVSSRDFQVVLEAALMSWIAGENGPASETWLAFAERVVGALADVAAKLRSGQTAVVCTSGGVLGALCVTLLGLPPESLVAFNRVTVNTGITKVVSGSSGSTLITFNEHPHLEGPARSLLSYR